MADDLRDKQVLFLAPCFLSWRLHKSIRGVQVFDLHFVRQLAELGLRLTIPAESSWKKQFAKHLQGVPFEPVYTPCFRKPLPNTLAAAFKLGKRRFDAVLLGNPSRGMLPGLRMMHRNGCFDHGALIAHRSIRPAFYKGVAHMNLTPVAVNEKISRLTSELSGEPVDIYYGLPNAREFSPAVSPRTSETVRLCLIGNLADPCKGTDVAIKAFMALPEDVRARAELHLASFKSPPEMPHENIIAHAWKPASEIPAFLQEMDVMLVPSVHETFSQAIVVAIDRVTRLNPTHCRRVALPPAGDR